jgi:hypothetical protein
MMNGRLVGINNFKLRVSSTKITLVGLLYPLVERNTTFFLLHLGEYLIVCKQNFLIRSFRLYHSKLFNHCEKVGFTSLHFYEQNSSNYS